MKEKNIYWTIAHINDVVMPDEGIMWYVKPKTFHENPELVTFVIEHAEHSSYDVSAEGYFGWKFDYDLVDQIDAFTEKFQN